MNPQTIYHTTQTRQPYLILNLLIVLAIIVSVALIFVTVAGYSTVKLNLPSNAVVRINDHVVSNGNLRMRPGNYRVIISSPTITPYQGTLSVGLFQSILYNPQLEKRNPETIASSLLGGAGQSGALQLGLIEWFNQNTWVAGLVGPSDASLALHYDSTKHQWEVGYYNGGGYSEDLSKLPALVAAYIEQLESQNAQG